MSLASQDAASPGIGSLGIRLRAARRSKGLTQADLAGPDYSVAYVSRIESGERTPSPEALATFARRLGVSLDSLLSPIDDAAMLEIERARIAAARGIDEADWDAARAAATELLQLAERHALPRFASIANRVLGELEERVGELDRALARYTEAERTVSDDVEDRVDMTVCLARVHRRFGDLGYSADLLTRAIAALEPEAELHPALMARLNLHLSATCSERGDYARARRAGLEAIEWARKAGDTRTLANALWAAAPPMAVANPARALSLIRRAGTLFAELGLTHELGRLQAMLGETALTAGDEPTARVALERASELIGPSAPPSVLSTILVSKAELERRDGNVDEAVRLARQVVDIAEGVEPLEQARARRVLGESLVTQDPEAAERELRAAIVLFTSAGAQMDAARCFRSLGDLLLALGRTDEAVAVFRDGLGAVEGAA
ncbi:MAG TPA: helix-turn-helix transcriptional regulator [Actinomycetota bacterium]|nr:helix-turn-helix transcriptional regulator [Actinomycetota bacterium]